MAVPATSPVYDDSLESPSFCIILERLQANITRLRSFVADHGLRLRPHVKTHKTREITALCLGASIEASRRSEHIPDGCVVVSTLAEAEFLSDLVPDILYGVPWEPSKLARCLDVHARARLSLMVDSVDAIAALETAYASAPRAVDLRSRPFGAYLKIDAGYRRAGVDVRARPDAALDVLRRIAACPLLEFRGLYSHSGNAYNAAGDTHTHTHARTYAEWCTLARTNAKAIADAELSTLLEFSERCAREGLRIPLISIGSTPSVHAHTHTHTRTHTHTDARSHTQSDDAHSTADDWTDPALLARAASLGVAIEVHPGNFVFFDRQQIESGACGCAAVSVYTLTRVIADHRTATTGEARNEVLLDAGSLALHKDTGGLRDGTYGCVLGCPPGTQTHASTQAHTHSPVLRRITQEVGVLGPAVKQFPDDPDVPPDFPEHVCDWRLGSVVRIMPNHACVCAAAHARFHIVSERTETRPDGSSRTVFVKLDEWQPCKFW